MSVYLDMKSLYPHLKANWNILMCKKWIARRLVVVTLELCIWYNLIFDLEMDNKKKKLSKFFYFIIIIFLK